MELEKIAQNEEMTYLEKVAAIVDEFAAGNVDGETADAVASEAGISPEDLLSVYNAAYGDADIEKTAATNEAEETLVKVAGDVNATYLEKCASIADAYAAGAISDEEGDSLAVEMGLNPVDVASVYSAAYGDMEKTAAAKDAYNELEKIAADENSTYLTKCAGVADAIVAGAFDGESAVEAIEALNLDGLDVVQVIDAAYGEDLGKEAGAKTDAVKKFITEQYSKVKSGAGKAYDYTKGKAKAGYEKTKAGASKAYTKAKEATSKAYNAAGGHKTAAGVAAGAAGGATAMHLLGKKDK